MERESKDVQHARDAAILQAELLTFQSAEIGREWERARIARDVDGMSEAMDKQRAVARQLRQIMDYLMAS